MKLLVVILMLCLCFCCLEGKELLEEERAKKKRTTRFWSTFLLLIFSKVAITKIIYAAVFWFVFHNVCLLVGWLINYWMKMKKPHRYVNMESYNQHDYNTVGYSYGPPKDSDLSQWQYAPNHQEEFNQMNKAPENWPYSKRSIE